MSGGHERCVLRLAVMGLPVQAAAIIRYGCSTMEPQRKRRVLAIDVGGSHVKMRLSNRREVRQFDSGPQMTARRMVAGVHKLVGDWNFDLVSIGYPGLVIHGKIVADPHNLGAGWVGFDFRRAFGRPTRIINDAAMQAIGSYQ